MLKKLPKQEPMWQITEGLTLREYYAGLAMQGILANPHTNLVFFDEITERAIKQADSPIKALEETK